MEPSTTVVARTFAFKLMVIWEVRASQDQAAFFAKLYRLVCHLRKGHYPQAVLGVFARAFAIKACHISQHPQLRQFVCDEEDFELRSLAKRSFFASFQRGRPNDAMKDSSYSWRKFLFSTYPATCPVRWDCKVTLKSPRRILDSCEEPLGWFL